MSEDKTESASQRRLQKAREDGDVPVSREAPLLAGLAGGIGALSIQLAASPAAPVQWFAHALAAKSANLHTVGSAILAGVLPCAIAASLAATAATLLQTGFLFRPQSLSLDLSRISPARGLKRMASSETLIQAGKSTLKLLVLSAAFWTVLRRLLPQLPALPARPHAALLPLLSAQLVRLAVPLIAAQLAIAAADLFWVRFQHASRLRMTRQEQRDEHKEAEGNPQVKQRLRQLIRLRGRRRMMAAVAKATVVVTNPTHYAVALLYERGSRSAPRVVGKGADEIAARIRELARDNHIPVVANPPLARALYRVELDTEIPAEHFKAVAEIVAYVWRLNRAAEAPRPG